MSRWGFSWGLSWGGSWGPFESEADAALSVTATATALFVGASDAPVVAAPPAVTVGGVGRAWSAHYRSKHRKKKDALEELDLLLEQVRARIVPVTREESDDMLRAALERGDGVNLKDTIVRIEAEIETVKELLAEIDDEEVTLLLL